MALSKIQETFDGPCPSVQIPKFVGAADLARIVIESFHVDPVFGPNRGYTSAASDAAIKEFIELAYLSSLEVEEGRPICPRLILARADLNSLPIPLTVRFPTPVPLSTPSTIKKLAPAADIRTSYLVVTESAKGELVFQGIAEDLPLHYSPIGLSPCFRSGWGIKDKIANVVVRVRSPGCLALNFGSRGFIFKSGAVRGVQPFSMVNAVWNLYAHAADATIALMKMDRSGSAENYLATYGRQRIVQDVAYWFDFALSTIIDRRHGGTIIVLPKKTTSHDMIGSIFSLEGGHPVDLDLVQALADFHLACGEVCRKLPGSDDTGAGNTPSELVNSVDRWAFSFGRAQVRAASLASLANIDGCVVLDAEMGVRLFGAKIQETNTLLPLVDWYDKTKSLDSELARLGTRHLSACRFCQSHRHAMAFVVSQDGDLRVFFSDETYTYGFSELDCGVGD